ncbi:MAG: hypothetical protein LQ338_005295 [Usnochroma carphineum]|nr:MAG: hypothetical protein LQ338_005295 [Usnochroma carphineum]
MFSALQTSKSCLAKSQISKQLLSTLHSPSLPFLAPALYSYSTKSAPVRPYELKPTPTNSSHQPKPPPPQKPTDTLNPPTSTLPPPLTLPTRQPDQSNVSFYYRTGKAYLTFYKSGIRAIYQNYLLLRRLRPRIPRSKTLEQALRDGVLSRAEYHLIRRTRRDVSRIPLFGIVLLICGEFTPLVVVFMGLSGAVPRTCHIPRQIDGAREKLEARRRESFREGTITTVQETGDLEDVQKLPKPILAHVGRSLGLYSSLWDRIGVVPGFLLPWRVRKAVERIEVDDLAIGRERGVKGLSEEEVKLAAEERGLDVLGKPVKEIRSELDRWMEMRKRRISIVDLLCRRPSAWPRN